MSALRRTGMAGVPGTANAIFGAVKDVGANVVMISQACLSLHKHFFISWCFPHPTLVFHATQLKICLIKIAVTWP